MTTHFPGVIQALLYSYHDHSLSWLNTGTSITKYHDHSLSWLNTGTSIKKNIMTTHFLGLIQALLYSYHDHSLSWLNTGTSIKIIMTTHFPGLIQTLRNTHIMTTHFPGLIQHFYTHIMTTHFPGLIQALLYSYHDHSLSWLNTGTSILISWPLTFLA